MASKFHPFNPAEETWRRFVKRLENHFEVQDIAVPVVVPPNAPPPDPNVRKRRASLLDAMGMKTYNKLLDKHGSDAVDAMDYDAIVTNVEHIINPAPLVISERFRFHHTRQKPGQLASEFMLELQSVALTCRFGDDAQNPEQARLRDQFVSGLANKEMQKFLLQQANLTFDNCVQFARNFEQAESTSSALNKGSTVVNAVSSKDKSKTSAKKGKPNGKKCPHCGRFNPKHPPEKCYALEGTCNHCQQKGHFKPACPVLKSSNKSGGGKFSKGKSGSVAKVEDSYDEDDGEVGIVEEVQLTSSFPASTPVTAPKLLVNFKVTGKDVTFIWDTGSGATLISSQLWAKLGKPPMEPAKVRFKSYSGHQIPVLGIAYVNVVFQGTTFKRLPVVVVRGQNESSYPILGRSWQKTLNLKTENCYEDLNSVLAIGDHMEFTESSAKPKSPSPTASNSGKCSDLISALLKKYFVLFDGSLGCLKNAKAYLVMKPGEFKGKKFWKPRPVPYALAHKVAMELKRLEERGIIEKIPNDISEYASPIVVVAKRGSDAVRICGDFKVCVNKITELEKFPLPTADDLFTKFSGCKKFASLDLSEAYHQMPLDEESQKFLVINTPLGLYRYKRLPFGVKSAPAIFQRAMEKILEGLPGVGNFLDDCLVGGKDDVELAQNLELVFQRFLEYGIRLNLNKCIFAAGEDGFLPWLGHQIGPNGISTATSKVEAVRNTPSPRNLSELRAFLGLVTYYGKFISHLATIARPMYDLLGKDVKWRWGKSQENSFQRIKKELSSAPILCHYDPKLPLGLATDASQYGVGAVLFHFKDGKEYPICYASASLTKSQRNYSQIEKEAFSLIFGVTKFRQYLYGRKFTLVTDHKPLEKIFGADHAIPDRVSSRLQRWALTLMGYDYDLVYKQGQKHLNADALSRLPMNVEAQIPYNGQDEFSDVFALDEVETNHQIFSYKYLAAEIKKDPVMQSLIRKIESGGNWDSSPELHPYSRHRSELSIENGCVFWGNRLIIPASMRKDILQELHQGHPGIQRMKNLARQFVWWPDMDSEIEYTVQTCVHCQSVRKEAPATSVHPWEFPEKPWYRLHVDFAGPYQNNMWMVVVDARTKWPEVIKMRTTTAAETVRAFFGLIGRFGVPAQIVSDNGPQFISAEFQDFCKRFNIQHIRVAPYHPRSNGEAERFVQTLKNTLGRKQLEHHDLVYRLNRFLLTYRNTAHSTTGIPPAQLLLGRRVRLPLDGLRQQPEDKVRESQEKQAYTKKLQRQYRPGDSVWFRDYRHSVQKWKAGMVVQHTGPYSYVIEADFQLYTRHADQMLPRNSDCVAPQDDDKIYFPPISTETQSPAPALQPALASSNHPATDSNPAPVEIPARTPPQPVRRSSRISKPPERYGYDSPTGTNLGKAKN